MERSNKTNWRIRSQKRQENGKSSRRSADDEFDMCFLAPKEWREFLFEIELLNDQWSIIGDYWGSALTLDLQSHLLMKLQLHLDMLLKLTTRFATKRCWGWRQWCRPTCLAFNYAMTHESWLTVLKWIHSMQLILSFLNLFDSFRQILPWQQKSTLYITKIKT